MVLFSPFDHFKQNFQEWVASFKPHSKNEALANLQPWFQAASARNVPGWRVQPWVYHFGLEGFLWWPSNVRRPQRGNVGQQVASSNEWRWVPLGECDPSPQCNSAWKLKIQKDFCIAWISELVTGISKKTVVIKSAPHFKWESNLMQTAMVSLRNFPYYSAWSLFGLVSYNHPCPKDPAVKQPEA